MPNSHITLELPHLNTPDYSDRLRIRQTADKATIWDPLRSKWVALTPEEWIRQNVTLYIADTLQVSTNLMAHETEIIYNGMSRRCDAVIYAPDGSPLIVVEYKQHRIPLAQHVFDQAVLYCMHLNVPYLIVSNGLQHLLCQIDKTNRRYIFAQTWPTYTELLKQTEN